MTFPAYPCFCVGIPASPKSKKSGEVLLLTNWGSFPGQANILRKKNGKGNLFPVQYSEYIPPALINKKPWEVVQATSLPQVFEFWPDKLTTFWTWKTCSCVDWIFITQKSKMVVFLKNISMFFRLNNSQALILFVWLNTFQLDQPMVNCWFGFGSWFGIWSWYP